VLPIGGLKEKSVAAHRNHVVDVIIPHANARDLEELPQEVRDAIRFHPVRTMDEVLKLALRSTSPDAGAQSRSRKRPRGQAVATVSAH
jgi:ATP-dependent Lon protease